jgi:ribosomal protein L39E
MVVPFWILMKKDGGIEAVREVKQWRSEAVGIEGLKFWGIRVLGY